MTRPVHPSDLLAIKTMADAQLTPDGSRVAYVVTEIDAGKDEYRASIWAVSADGGKPKRITRGRKNHSAPRFSPDGARLAFLSDRDGKPAQLYVVPTLGGKPRKFTSLANGAGPAVWSPDGKRILFAATVLTEARPADKDARELWKQRPKVVTKAQYKADGQGYTFDARSHLFVVDAATGETKQLTDGDCEERAPAWSPNGTHVAFSRTRSAIADYSASDLWVVDVASHDARRLTENVGRATSPSWSPDGKTIACYGADEQNARALGDPMVRVWIVPVAGGEPRRLTANYDRSVMLLAPPAATPGATWSSDGGTLTFNASDVGSVHVVRVATSDGAVSVVVSGERQVTSASIGAQRIAFIAADLYNPGDVSVCDRDGAHEKRLTHLNEALLAELTLPKVVKRKFNNPNGGTNDGWVTMPLQADGPAPLLVDIHGGPHGFHGNAIALGYFYRYALAAQGWATLALNPTGSGSYGRRFAHDIRGRWGEYDLPEQLAAADTLIAEGIADANRLAVAGYSYGGFMTAWTITHSDRFKAAVVGAPVVNHESMHGTSDIGMWFTRWELDGDIHANRETFRALSPINYVERVVTPTLVLHGEADDRCPIGQGEELFAGLVNVGKAPTEFVRYPGGSHLFIINGRPSHRVDFCRRVIEWVTRYTLKL